MWRNLSRTQKVLASATVAGGIAYQVYEQKHHARHTYLSALKHQDQPTGTLQKLMPRNVAFAEALQQQQKLDDLWQAPSRETMLNKLKAGEEYDLLVVGGGATGTGTALDATTRGLNVALVERDDFASGK
jgi:glycerol-3-phosphate dehydrogenase